jgi:multidrug resistance efflux pump
VRQDGRPAPASLSDRVRSLRLPDQKAGKRPGGSRPGRIFVLISFVLALALSVVAYQYYQAVQQISELRTETAKQPKQAGNEDSPAPTTSVDVGGQVASGDVVLERKGYITPAHLILVSPKVSGMIVKLNIEEGVHVQKDQVLAELESVDYEADYQHCRAGADSAWQKFIELYTGNREQEVRQAKADLDEMVATRKQLYLDWNRSNKLTGAALADRDYEQAESLYKAMDRRVEKMRAAYSLMLEGARIERIESAWADAVLAEADSAKAKWKLDNCLVRAPVSGTILSKEAEIGNLVNPIAFNGSYSLCKMANLSEMEVDLSIEERDVAKIFKGQRCKVRAEAYPDLVYQGVVSRLMPMADRAKSAIPVRVRLTVPKEDEGIHLKPEMGAIVAFLKQSSEQAKNVVRVP